MAAKRRVEGYQQNHDIAIHARSYKKVLLLQITGRRWRISSFVTNRNGEVCVFPNKTLELVECATIYELIVYGQGNIYSEPVENGTSPSLASTN